MTSPGNPRTSAAATRQAPEMSPTLTGTDWAAHRPRVVSLSQLPRVTGSLTA